MFVIFYLRYNGKETDVNHQKPRVDDPGHYNYHLVSPQLYKKETIQVRKFMAEVA